MDYQKFKNEKKTKDFAQGDSNFMSTNGALVTHAIWKEAIKSGTAGGSEEQQRKEQIQKIVAREVQNIYEIAKQGGNSGSVLDTQLQQIAGCRKCGLLGHLTNQCMNVLKDKNGNEVKLVDTKNMLGGVNGRSDEMRNIEKEVEKNDKMLKKLEKAIDKKKEKKKLKKKIKKLKDKEKIKKLKEDLGLKKKKKKSKKRHHSSSSSGSDDSDSSSSD
ncbi:cax-interacting protein [Stylonychia lemnae]|uniref:Cax-interacting protein n=1 Tax=Stylonychia lemnae TaxID=5949 RepID=A0A078A7V6_STYLE|nr:cax-interacting protein [Stylonychia lemnae]|eukprot:CDW77926.1 cax-interacting protein [Stylonychia lemnae]